MTFLPETSNQKLPDTIEEGEEMGKGDTFYTYLAEKFRRGKNQSDDAKSNEPELKFDNEKNHRRTSVMSVRSIMDEEGGARPETPPPIP